MFEVDVGGEFTIEAIATEFVEGCQFCDLLIYRLIHDDGTMVIHISIADDGAYYAFPWPCDEAWEQAEVDMQPINSMRAGSMPNREPPTTREQIAEVAEDDQAISFGQSGVVFTPYHVLRGIVQCDECGDSYISKEALDAHECPMMETKQQEDENAQ
jgi:hypothetical protein